MAEFVRSESELRGLGEPHGISLLWTYAPARTRVEATTSDLVRTVSSEALQKAVIDGLTPSHHICDKVALFAVRNS